MHWCKCGRRLPRRNRRRRGSPRWRRSWRRWRPAFTAPARCVGDAGETAFLLRRVELLASGTGLGIRGFAPQPALVHELHTEWPTRLELSGGYHELLAFFERLADCAVDIVVEDLAIRAVDAPDAGATVAAAGTITALGFNAGTGVREARAADDAACPPRAAGGRRGGGRCDRARRPLLPLDARRGPASRCGPGHPVCPGCASAS